MSTADRGEEGGEALAISLSLKVITNIGKDATLTKSNTNLARPKAGGKGGLVYEEGLLGN